MFWYTWPSWLTELLGGITMATMAQPLPAEGWRLLACTAVSLGYEWRVDQNGWSTIDAVQRQVGILVGLILWQFIR